MVYFFELPFVFDASDTEHPLGVSANSLDIMKRYVAQKRLKVKCR